MNKDELKIVGKILIVAFTVLAGISWYDKGVCLDVQEQTGHETKFSWRSGCYMQTPKGFVPYEHWTGTWYQKDE